MTFVNELIPEAEKKFTFHVETRYDGSKRIPKMWTIDRERNAYLVMTWKIGGSYEGTQETRHYAMSWNEDLVYFSGDPKISGNLEIGQIMSWRVHNIKIPIPLMTKKTEVLQLISEALDAMGWLYDRKCLVAVNIEIDDSAIDKQGLEL